MNKDGNVMDGYTTQSWANTCTTATAPDLNQLAQTCAQMNAETDRANAMLIDGLNAFISQSNRTVFYWADRLRVNDETLLAILAGRRKPDWYFWENVRRVFEPMRDAVKEAATNG